MHDLGEDFPRIFHARGGEPLSLSSPDFFLSTIHSSDDFRFPRGLRNHHRARHPLPKDGEFERGVFNRRSTATVESRSRREPPNNWHTLPRDWQLPPVPPRSCNPRHARIHGLRRRTGNRRGRSSDASCPSSTATPIPCAPSSIRVLAEACESSSLSLILSSPKLWSSSILFVTFDSSSSVSVPRKQAVVGCPLFPPKRSCFLFSRSVNSFTTWKRRYRVNKRNGRERSWTDIFQHRAIVIDRQITRLFARSNLSQVGEFFACELRSSRDTYSWNILSLCTKLCIV